jgi:hypothetical protein
MGFNDFVRRGQLIVPFGVGAMIDFPEDTLMTAALDYWPYESDLNSPEQKDAILEATKITDARLQKRLSQKYKKQIKFFLAPTEGRRARGQDGKHLSPMAFVRFPTMLTCPYCKVLKSYALNVKKTPKCDSSVRGTSSSKGILCSERKEYQRAFMEPVRFLIACERGHIDDFPWVQWVHSGKECSEQNGTLFLRSTGAPGLAGTRVECTCGKKRTMEGAFTKGVIKKFLPDECCTGRQPWLGNEHQWGTCEKDAVGEPRTIQRGSSSTHFSHIISSILIPPYSKAVRVYFDSKPALWDEIKEIFDEAPLSFINDKPYLPEANVKEFRRKIKRSGFEYEVCLETAANKYREIEEDTEALDEDDISYRFREYGAFIGERPPVADRGFFDINRIDLENYEYWIKSYFSSIVRVEQLKETRVFTGFSRLTPLSAGDRNEAPINLNRNIDWLPAAEVRGEGIFFQFKADAVKAWVKERAERAFSVNLDQIVKKRILNDEPNLTRRESVSEEFLLVHSFAHALIKQLAFECGYDASSLKERIFVGDGEDKEMCSVLVYTASGDSEGSLGGLVERAKPGLLERTLKDAIREMEFCSNDPICSDTGISRSNKDNIVSCHACNMLPETSCEHSNFLLDRSALVGTFDKKKTGYFSALLNPEI